MTTPPEARLPSAAVAIATYLREEVLVETIQQVLAQRPPADEVLVIDQTPEHLPPTTAYLGEQRDSGRIRWIRQPRPNLPAARNRALQETDCEVVIFIDDDVTLTPGFVENHRKNYRDPAVGGVAGRSVQEPPLPIPHRNRPWPRLFDYLYFPVDSTERVEGIATFHGANHSVRRKAILDLGGYDDNYLGSAFREEADVAIRLWRSGVTVVFDPKACLTHLVAPFGGCRVDDKAPPRPEWMLSYPPNYFAFRHLFPGMRFWTDIFLLNLRRFVFRKHTVFRPWLLPWAACSYLYSTVRAMFAAIRKRSKS